jgi:uncharacterized protein
LSAATPRSIGARAAGLGLLVAWLALLGALGAAVGYVLFLPEADTGPGPVPVIAIQVPPEPPGGGPKEARAETTEPQAAPSQMEDKTPAAPPMVKAPVQETAAAPGDDTAPPAPKPAETTASETKPSPSKTQEAALPATPTPAPEILPPWRRNAQPFDAPAKLPRIAVVLTGLGMSSAATEAAIKQLPSAISLSFTPYSRRLNEWIALARVNGHEVLLDLPMEPTSYPDDDPGPQALLTALSERQNLARLDWALRRATGFVGVTAVMGSRFLASEEHLTPILKELKNRGMMFLDNRASEASLAGPLAQKLGLASAVNDRFLDRAQASRVAIDDRLVQLERIARTEGFAVAIGQTYPVTIERLRAWAAEVETRGFVLAPLSSIAAERLARQTASRENSEQ